VSFLEVLSGILKGLNVTLTVTALGMIYAVPFAFAAGIAQYCWRGPAYAAITAVIEIWRSTSVVILLYGFYYILPSAGLRLSGIAVGSMVLGLHIGAYGSQAVRGALQALDNGQNEAGRSLGMCGWQILFLIELPQALLAMVPTFINQFIQLVKGTALVSLVTLTDMTFRAKEISQLFYDPPKVYFALLVAYFMLCYPATIVGRWVERKVGTGRKLDHGI
jgi:polar amino acid transport system permease protein